MSAMVHRIFSLLLVLGTLVPQLPMCLEMGLGGSDCAVFPSAMESGCCCSESGAAGTTGPGFSSNDTGSRTCACESPEPLAIAHVALSSGAALADALAHPAESAALSDRPSNFQDVEPLACGVVPKRPLRITLGVLLI